MDYYAVVRSISAVETAKGPQDSVTVVAERDGNVYVWTTNPGTYSLRQRVAVQQTGGYYFPVH